MERREARGFSSAQMSGIPLKADFAPSDIPPVRDSPSSVLCVDDDRDFCRILSETLGEEGYAVRTAFDGDQALVELSEHPPDIALLDLILPRRDGFAVLEALRAMDSASRDTPVVLITGCSPTPQNRERAKALGVVELLTKPVPLDELLDVVARYAGERKTEDVRHSEPPPRLVEPRPAGLSGSLDELPLPALLHHLHGLRATGVLHLSNGKKRKWIALRDGYPTAVRSNLLNECLGNLLVRRGKISQAAFAESRRRVKPGRLQGEILVAMEIVSEEEIADALRAQADEKLFEAFRWRTGKYRFERGAGLERGNSLGVERSPANLILRGVREYAPIEMIDKYIGSHADCYLTPAESPFYQFQEVDLDPKHEELLASVDGTQRLAEFLKADEDLKRTLYAILAFGLLELEGGRKRAAAAPRPARDARTQPTAKGEEVRARLTALADRMRKQNYFEILGVDESTTEQELRAAFEKRAAILHPDRYRKTGDAVAHLATEVFAQLNTAYQTLADPRRRSEYVLNQRKGERDAERRRESEKALEAEVQFQEGQRLLAQRAYERALQAFGRALELYPEAGEYHSHYGWTLHLCHPDQPDIASEAIEHVRRGIKLAGQRETSYLYMGRLCKAIGRVELAEKMFARAVQLEPGCVEALRELRLINLRRKKSKGLIGRLLRR